MLPEQMLFDKRRERPYNRRAKVASCAQMPEVTVPRTLVRWSPLSLPQWTRRLQVLSASLAGLTGPRVGWFWWRSTGCSTSGSR